jgi:hypothetical protein
VRSLGWLRSPRRDSQPNEKTAERFFGIFTANIRNKNTKVGI